VIEPPVHCPGARERAPGTVDHCGLKWGCARYYYRGDLRDMIEARWEGLACPEFRPLQPQGRNR